MRTPNRDLDPIREKALELLQKNGDILWRICNRILDDTENANDTYQIVCMEIITKIDAILQHPNPEFLIRRIAVTNSIDFARKRGRYRKLFQINPGEEIDVENIPSVGAPPDDIALTEELKKRATTALNSLTNELRSIIVLRFFESMKYVEIAASLGIPLGTVKTRLRQALIKLKEILDNDPSFREE